MHYFAARHLLRERGEEEWIEKGPEVVLNYVKSQLEKIKTEAKNGVPGLLLHRMDTLIAEVTTVLQPKGAKESSVIPTMKAFLKLLWKILTEIMTYAYTGCRRSSKKYVYFHVFSF